MTIFLTYIAFHGFLLFTIAFKDPGLVQRQNAPDNQTLEDYCYPFTSSEYDMNAPCNKALSVKWTCTIDNTEQNDYFADLIEYYPEYQQYCLCEMTSFWSNTLGCNNCAQERGDYATDPWYPDNYISSLAISYCEVPTARLYFTDFIDSYMSATPPPSVTTSRSDALGTQTAVSVYYTSYSISHSSVPSVSPSSGRLVSTATATAAAAAAVDTASTGSIASTGTAAKSTSSTVPSAGSASATSGAPAYLGDAMRWIWRVAVCFCALLIS